MCCPNCSAQISAEVATCPRCGAEFGLQSAWRPTQRARPARARSRTPKRLHAVQSVAVFAVVGPLAGLLALEFLLGKPGSMGLVAHPFGVIGAYAVGGTPALLAGALYCIATLLVVFVARTAAVGPGVGALLGALAGVATAAPIAIWFLPGAGDYETKRNALLFTCLVAGACAGLASGWLLPVGWTRHAAPHEG
jgi:hypothetical protein